MYHLKEIWVWDKRFPSNKYPEPGKEIIEERIKKTLKIWPIIKSRIISFNVIFCGRVYVYSFKFSTDTNVTEN
jgi:hypothetical protein